MRWLIGFILVVAAWLKWSSFGSGRPSMLAEIAPQLEWMLIQLEFVLGIWLILGWSPRLSWLASLLLFSSFAGASLMMVVQGRSSCGCLGAVELKPVWILLIDLLVIGVLLVSGRGFAIRNNKRDATGDAAPFPLTNSFLFASRSFVLIAAGGLLGALAISQSAWLGSALTVYVPPEVSGQYLVANPAIIDVGVGHPGQWQTLKVQIHNRSDLAVTLIGAEQGCRCRAIGSLPVEIAAGDRAEIEVRVQLGQTAGVQHDRFWLLTSHQRQGLLICRWRANVLDKQESRSEAPSVSAAVRNKSSCLNQISSPGSGSERILRLFQRPPFSDSNCCFSNLNGASNRAWRLQMPVGFLFHYQGVL